MMPAYNAEVFLREAFESMRQQYYENWELCIVDDGSSDGTYDLMSDLATQDSRVKIHQIEHQGCPVARNECLKICDGDIIARLDADDLHHPNRLYAQVKRLTSGESDIVTCKMSWLVNDLYLPRPADAMDVKNYMNGIGRGPACATIVAWRHVYDEVGGFDPELPAGSDGDWNFRAIVSGMSWDHIAEHYYYQRRHERQISKRLGPQQRRAHTQSRMKYRKLWKKQQD